MTVAIPEAKKFAEQYVHDHKQEIIDDLAERVSLGISTGRAQIKNGQYTPLENLESHLKSRFNTQG